MAIMMTVFSLILMGSISLFICFSFRIRAAAIIIERDNAKLRKRLDTCQSLLDSMPVSAFAIDQDGNILESNLRFQNFADMEITDIRQSQTSFATPQISASNLEQFCKALRANATARHEDLHLNTGGIEHDVYFWSIPFYDIHGTPAGNICGWLDISERVQLEADLRRAKLLADQSLKALEEASKIKSTFLSNVSHEIRTPLNVIIGSLEIGLLEKAEDDRNGSPQAMALEAAQHLLALIDDILDFSKIEASKLVLRPGPVRLIELLAHACQLYEIPFSRKQIHFDCELAAIPDSLWVTLDGVRFKQVLTNLLANAVKFTPEHGVVRVRAKATPICAQSVVIEIAVADNGIGISPADQARLFQPFSQAAHGRSQLAQASHGTGLGLAICRQLIELMGGKITLDSALDHGTTVTIVLQLACCAEKQHAQPQAQGSVTGATGVRKVLIVDDHLLNLAVLEAQFKHFDCEVVQADSGEKALALASATRFDLIVTDYSMPGMNGSELTRAIRALERSRQQPRTRIIGLTAFTQGEYHAEALAAGMDHCLHKPVGITEWAHILHGLALPPTATAAETGTEPEPLAQPVSLAGVQELAAADTQKELLLLESIATHCANDWRSALCAHQQNDWQTLREKMHRIRSMTNMFGLTALGWHCAMVEQQATAAKHGRIEEALAGTEMALQALVSAIHQRTRQLRLVCTDTDYAES